MLRIVRILLDVESAMPVREKRASTQGRNDSAERRFAAADGLQVSSEAGAEIVVEDLACRCDGAAYVDLVLDAALAIVPVLLQTRPLLQ